MLDGALWPCVPCVHWAGLLLPTLPVIGALLLLWPLWWEGVNRLYWSETGLSYLLSGEVTLTLYSVEVTGSRHVVIVPQVGQYLLQLVLVHRKLRVSVAIRWSFEAPNTRVNSGVWLLSRLNYQAGDALHLAHWARDIVNIANTCKALNWWCHIDLVLLSWDGRWLKIFLDCHNTRILFAVPWLLINMGLLIFINLCAHLCPHM